MGSKSRIAKYIVPIIQKCIDDNNLETYIESCVGGVIPLIEPETITYNNIFARTKRERNKILTTIKKYEEKSIFSMSDDKAQYKGYPVIPELCANSETELKDKVDMWLEGLIELINKPLCQCPQCKGTGYLDDISKTEFNYS